MRTKGTAALLAFLLGGIGVHKFYLGQHFQGIMYLLFCWTFIPVLIAFIEIFVYLLMSDEDFNRRYNSSAVAHQAHRGNQMGQNVTINLSDHQQRMPQGTRRPSITAELKELKELHVAGVLTDDEFRVQKQRLLSDSNAPARRQASHHPTHL